MKVLNLRCAQQHFFEGWFASDDDHRQQSERGLLCCPVCGDASVQKMPSAPRLNLGHAREPDGAARAHAAAEIDATALPVAARSPADWPPQLVQALREYMDAAEDVGDRFADEARAMHHGDVEHRNIRGRAELGEALALLEEGVDILPLPSLPPAKRLLH